MKTKLFISVYIDIGSGSSNSATVAFDFGTTSSTSRQWDIKVAQIPCGSSYGYWWIYIHCINRAHYYQTYFLLDKTKLGTDGQALFYVLSKK